MARTAPTHSRSAAKRNRVRERWAQRGFSPNDLLNLWKPNGAWEQYRGLAYGERPRQKLDVYRPRHAAKAPILLFFYGGSWQRGSRDPTLFGTSLAAQGTSRLCRIIRSFRRRFPMFVEDAARAGDLLAIAPAAILAAGATGHSAGAYIAAMLSFDPAVKSRSAQLADRSRGLYRFSRSV